MLLLHVQKGDAQHGAVGGNQGQEDAQYPVQERTGLAHDHFGELHQGRDHQDETEGRQVFQPQRPQKPGAEQVARYRCEGQYEHRGHRHADGPLELVGDSHEGAQAQESNQYKIVRQYGADQNQEIFGHEPG
jgi:hypothetical protein